MQQKYVWDITVGRSFSKRQIKMVDLVSSTLTHGGNVRELQKALKQLSFPVK